ncbi:MAG: PQQ-binding-like beta-propeller repeat protein [Paracoccaceae bacterium]
MRQSRLALIGIFAVLAACAQQDPRLPGERLDIRALQTPAAALQVDRAAPIRLSRQINNQSWTHRAGNADHAIQHPAFGTAPDLAWATPIGQGNDRRYRITADPVAADGRIFTLDSRATVAATATSGASLWSRDLTPPGEDAYDASGGGLALGKGTLFVTTGFGELVALEAASGAELWRQQLDAAATGAPSVKGNQVFVVTRDARAWAIDTTSGRVKWQLAGTPSGTGVVGGAGPAIGNKLVIFPYGSTEMVAALRTGGLQMWRSSVSGSRVGRVYAKITDITGDPVLRGGVIYAGNPSGRTVAIDAEDGTRIWTAQEGATGPVWVDGGAVFLISDQAELIRLNAANGGRVWGVPLPGIIPQRRARRERDVYANFGPVLAGGRLWVASGDGQLRGFDPVDGSLSYATALPGGAASRPIVVDKVMYLVSADGQLLAFD